MQAKTIAKLISLSLLLAFGAALGFVLTLRSCLANTERTPYVYTVSLPPSPSPALDGGAREEVPPEATPTVLPEPDFPVDEEADRLAGVMGYLAIGRKEIPIADNVDESTLKKSPGWMPGSALPGEGGMCVILGHRNRKHLRPLQNVEIGDTITYTYPDGRSAAYTVAQTTIYENTKDWTLPALDGDTLVLVTCWPFRYSGSAPGKFQVVCVA